MTRHRPGRACRRRGVAAALAIVIAMLAAGCDNEPRAAEPAPTATVGATEPALPTPTPTSTPTRQPTPNGTEERTFEPPNVAEPELATTGEDLEKVVKSLHAYRSWLFRSPHPDNATARLERIADPDCNCWEPDHTLLTHYAENELWWVGAVLEPVSVEALDRSAQNAAILGVVFERDGEAELIDHTGDVHDELEPTRYYLEIVLVRDDAESPWRLRSVSDVRPPPEEEEQEG